MSTTSDVLAGGARWAIETSGVVPYLRSLPNGCVHTCVTSPPYFQLRDYGVDGQIGLEPTPEAFIAALVEVFREVHRVLHPTGTLWVNIGDSYNNAGSSKNGEGLDGRRRGGATGPEGECGYRKRDNRRAWRDIGIKHKDLIGIPWMLAFALRADGWYLRQDVIWHKPSPMPSSVKDRCTTAHEYLFLLSKEPRYYFDTEAISETAVTAGQKIKMADGWDTGPGGHTSIHRDGREKGKHSGATQAETRMKRSVWRVASKPFKGAHFATFPPDLVRPCIRAGSSERGCCPACLAPWQRITERRRRATRPGTASKVTGDTLKDGNRDPQRHVTTTTTIGWRPTCRCEAGEPIPCLILDPFGGSGTTVAVANEEGRRGIACDLNPDYVALAHERMAGVVFGSGGPAKKAKRPRREKEAPHLFSACS